MTPFAAARVSVGAGHNTLPAVTVVKTGLLRVPAAGTYVRAGAQTAGAPGLAGTTRILAACAAGPCNDSFRGAGAPRPVAGHYAAWVQLSLTQSPRTGTAFGFDVEFAVKTASGWFVADGYFSSGRSTARGGQTVLVDLLIDLGTRTLPVLTFADVTLSACGSTAGCP